MNSAFFCNGALEIYFTANGIRKHKHPPVLAHPNMLNAECIHNYTLISLLLRVCCFSHSHFEFVSLSFFLFFRHHRCYWIYVCGVMAFEARLLVTKIVHDFYRHRHRFCCCFTRYAMPFIDFVAFCFGGTVAFCASLAPKTNCECIIQGSGGNRLCFSFHYSYFICFQFPPFSGAAHQFHTVLFTLHRIY